MTLVPWAAAAAVASSAIAMAIAGPRYAVEIMAGMAGPLGETIVSWVVAEQVFRRRPERLTNVMIGAFAGKLVFFGAYVAVVVSVLSLKPVPFMASFTAYFIALHLVEALALRRLFDRSTRASD